MLFRATLRPNAPTTPRTSRRCAANATESITKMQKTENFFGVEGGGRFGEEGGSLGHHLPSGAEMCTQAVLDYNASVLDGRRVAGKWIFAAARRFAADLERHDLVLDWKRVADVAAHCRRLRLIGDYSDASFELAPWQLWVVAQLLGWRWRDDGTNRVRQGLLQVARGNGKTTFAAALCLYDLWGGNGRRVHVVANREEQAAICVDTARTMARPLERPDTKILHNRIVCPLADGELSGLPAHRSSLDGLTPSLWIADEVAEFRDREILTKLETTGGKRSNTLGLMISTPADNPEGVYAEKVRAAEAVLTGEVDDDAFMPIIYGIDAEDQLSDESAWPKANPGLEHGQPKLRGLQTLWKSRKNSAVGRAEFSRYVCARTAEETTNWLDMNVWPGGQTIDWEALRGRQAFVGLDLSKNLDMTALVVAVPLDDGRVALRGHYWWPAENARQRELDYRLPVRTWAAERRLTLTPGSAIDYGAVAATAESIMQEFQVAKIGYDRWGSSDMVERLNKIGAPLEGYSMGVSTYGPGCQLFQQLWASGAILIGDDPILKTACRTAEASRDRNGNITVSKSKQTKVIDSLVASIIAVHCWGGRAGTSWDFLLS